MDVFHGTNVDHSVTIMSFRLGTDMLTIEIASTTQRYDEPAVAIQILIPFSQITRNGGLYLKSFGNICRNKVHNQLEITNEKFTKEFVRGV